MAYFERLYPHLKFPFAEKGLEGLRPPQSGAMHAIAAHFSLNHVRPTPAIITLPTGTGKTVVLLATPFLLRSERVLVLTPSRLLREQLAELFADLSPLKKLGVFGAKVRAPRVHAIRHCVSSEEDWKALQKFDVVISTPYTLGSYKYSEQAAGDESLTDGDEAHTTEDSSDGADENVPMPPDLFDAILIDEAHHAAASKWKAVLDRARTAKHVLFTATPFRRDKRALPGRLAYTYHLRDAFRDGYFGQLSFEPVTVPDGTDPDIAIASAAQAAFFRDRKAGYDHSIMVRTASRSKAKRLLELYKEEAPKLRLELVTGDKSLSAVRATLSALKKRELDGVICVDMLGEGFDFARLKLAALHSPHKSLAVTLQFIGRFARTIGKKLGPATFLGIPSEIRIEREALYAQGAIWETIIPNLSEAAVAEELDTQEALASFDSVGLSSSDVAEDEDMSAFALRPHQHVRIYDVGPAVDITTPIKFPRGVEIVRSFVSLEEATCVSVTRRTSRPDWTEDSRFDAVRYDLFIVFHHAPSGLLFVSASDRTPAIYAAITKAFAKPDGSEARFLSQERVSRVLLDMEKIKVYSLGLRSRKPGRSGSESYRISGGTNVLSAIDSTVVSAFRRGHVFASGIEDGESVSLGLSSSAKVWSTGALRVPGLIRWCSELAKKVMRDEIPKTNSNLDRLSPGEELSSLPANLLVAEWPSEALSSAGISARFQDKKGNLITRPLLDLSLSIDFQNNVNNSVKLVIEGDGAKSEAIYSPFCSQPITALPQADVISVLVSPSATPIDVWAFLAANPPTLFTTDLDSVEGRTLYRRATRSDVSYDSSRIKTRDWVADKVDIGREFGPTKNGLMSIHTFLFTQLVATSDHDAVLYDHGSGEIADFVTLKVAEDSVAIWLWHCKGAKGKPNERVADWYELCGQGARSYAYQDREWLLQRITERCTRKTPSVFLKGDIGMMRSALTDPERLLVPRVMLVQPGLSVAKMTPTVGALLSATHAFLNGNGCRFMVLASV